MKAQIISIGNELLIGDTVNTNASWMGNFLTQSGFEVTEVHTISDRESLIKSTIKYALSNSDVVLCTGGLGPTHDDITKKAVADLFNVSMRTDEGVLKFIRTLFESRNLPFSKSNYEQAEIPDNAEVLFNKMGTAPGIWIEDYDKCLVLMPGVPFEMKYLMKNEVAPKLITKFGEAEVFVSKYIQTAGIGESTLSDEILGDLSEYFNSDVSLAFLPNAGKVTLRLNGRGRTNEEANDSIKELEQEVYRLAGNLIYGEGKEYELSEEIGSLLNEMKLTIATAESCTGGLISSSLTDISGSSAYVKGGVVAYSNEIKSELLGVSDSDLKKFGAVSKQVALQMAKGVAEKLNADIGISTTGVAGPTGGSEEKPVGTVWIGFYSKDEHFAINALFTKDRLLNKERSKIVALEMVRRILVGISEMPYSYKKEYN